MRKSIVIRPESCLGCRACELICSFRLSGSFSPHNAAVTVCRLEGRIPAVPLMCMHCSAPACVAVCPTGALYRDEETGAILLEGEKCIRCGRCAAVCSLGAVRRGADGGQMIKCSLCGGKPACVDVCPAGAIDLVDSAAVEEAAAPEKDG